MEVEEEWRAKAEVCLLGNHSLDIEVDCPYSFCIFEMDANRLYPVLQLLDSFAPLHVTRMGLEKFL